MSITRTISSVIYSSLQVITNLPDISTETSPTHHSYEIHHIMWGETSENLISKEIRSY